VLHPPWLVMRKVCGKLLRGQRKKTSESEREREREKTSGNESERECANERATSLSARKNSKGESKN